MAERIEVELPERFTFSTEIAIRIGDVNYGGHVGYDTVLSIVHEARVRLFAARGWTELDIGKSGIGIAIAAVAAVYRAEGKYGMTLAVELAVGGLRSRGCELWCRLSDRASGREVARVRTSLVFFDYATGKVASMPAAFAAAFRPAPEG